MESDVLPVDDPTYDESCAIQHDDHNPFGSLIELAYKLKNVRSRLLKKSRRCKDRTDKQQLQAYQADNGQYNPVSCTYTEHTFTELSTHQSLHAVSNSASQIEYLSSEYGLGNDFCNGFPMSSRPHSDEIPNCSQFDSMELAGVEFEKHQKYLKNQKPNKSVEIPPVDVVYGSFPKQATSRRSHSTGAVPTQKSPRLAGPVHDPKRKHTCPLCMYQTDSRFHMQRHLSSVHNADKAYYCYVCKKEFSRSERVKAHFLSIHPEITYHPRITRKELYLAEDRQEITMESTGVMSSAVAYATVVTERFEAQQSSGCKIEEPEVHTSWERYCQISSEPFSEQRIFCCRYCSHGGDDIWLMKKHYLDMHLGVTTYACRICRYSSSCMTRMVSHMIGHGELICFYCSYSATDVKLFEKHLQECQNLVHCSVCQMSFSDKQQLETHTVNAHQFMLVCCTQCAFTSQSPAELSAHQSLHAHSNSALAQEVESEDEILLGPYRSLNTSVTSHFPKHTAIQAPANSLSENLADCNSSGHAEQAWNGWNGFDDKPILGGDVKSNPYNVYCCLVPGCGFTASWKKSLELHTENYHSIYVDDPKNKLAMLTCQSGIENWQSMLDCPASGFFPCPFCPNFRTFKYRKSFEKHLAQHGLDLAKYPYLTARLNLKFDQSTASRMD